MQHAINGSLRGTLQEQKIEDLLGVRGANTRHLLTVAGICVVKGPSIKIHPKHRVRASGANWNPSQAEFLEQCCQ